MVNKLYRYHDDRIAPQEENEVQEGGFCIAFWKAKQNQLFHLCNPVNSPINQSHGNVIVFVYQVHGYVHTCAVVCIYISKEVCTNY